MDNVVCVAAGYEGKNSLRSFDLDDLHVNGSLRSLHAHTGLTQM